eukprot:COSAG06_NODE_3283_length_5558_cov_2.577761_8_plen_117_part_00
MCLLAGTSGGVSTLSTPAVAFTGCTIGCETCDGNGGRPGDGSMKGVGACRCPGHCINSTNNNPKYRTANRGAVAGSKEDWTRYNPWRAPGVRFDPLPSLERQAGPAPPLLRGASLG